jgi:hypothetical protein
LAVKRCTVCGEEIPKGAMRKTCSYTCANEAKARGKRGDANPMKRPEVAARMTATGRSRRVATEHGAIPAGATTCARPGCPNPLTGQAKVYCSARCHYDDRARSGRGRRREQPYHRCQNCGEVFAWNGKGKGVYCSDECAHQGNVAREVEVVEVVRLRGHRRADFKDDVLRCRHCAKGHAHNHHVVLEQHVIRCGGDRWHPDNALALCRRCHLPLAHARKLPLTTLRDENLDFAFNLLGSHAYDYMRRRYAGDDPRLDERLRQIEEAA